MKRLNNIINKMIETVKKNDNTFTPIIEKTIKDFEEAYKEAIDKSLENIMYWHEEDDEVYIDYQSICEDFVDELEDVCAIDIDEFMRTDEYQEAEDNGDIDANGCFDDKYQFGLYILSNVTDYYRFQNLFYTGEMTFDMDEEDFEKLQEAKEKFKEGYNIRIKERNKII